MFDWVVFDKGRARFCGGQRGVDDVGQEILAVQLESGPSYYGQFDTKYDLDGSHYNVEVLNFGYLREIEVGLPSRHAFTAAEIENIRSIISGLMLSDNEKPFPLHRHDRFLGQTLFRQGWIDEK